MPVPDENAGVELAAFPEEKLNPPALAALFVKLKPPGCAGAGFGGLAPNGDGAAAKELVDAPPNFNPPPVLASGVKLNGLLGA